jgi:TonB family protein
MTVETAASRGPVSNPANKGGKRTGTAAQAAGKQPAGAATQPAAPAGPAAAPAAPAVVLGPAPTPAPAPAPAAAPPPAEVAAATPPIGPAPAPAPAAAPPAPATAPAPPPAAAAITAAPAKPVEVALPTIPSGIVNRVAWDHSKELSKCEGKDALKGEVTVKFHVTPDGKVTKPQITTAMGKPKLAACILRSLTTWKFPRQPAGGSQGTYTIAFQ